MNAETLGCPSHHRWIKAGAFDEDIGCGIIDFGILSAHDTCKRHGFFTVADGQVFRRQSPFLAVERGEDVPLPCPFDDDLAAGEELEIECMQGMTVFQQDIVGYINHVIDGAHAYCRETVHHPCGRRPDGAAGDKSGRIPGASFDSFNLYRCGQPNRRTFLRDIVNGIPHLRSKLCSYFPGNADHAQAVRSIRRQPNFENGILEPQRFKQGNTNS